MDRLVFIVCAMCAFAGSVLGWSLHARWVQ